MLALEQIGRFVFVALPILARWIAAKFDFLQSGSRVWVTSRTGNVTVVTDRLH
ncbi:MAG TPA: hypothetical protein VE263_02595 [Candidatus Angelobacter sp.]|nr:hypothetical protein [Candidatus Angelobacter sp.]